MRRTLSAPMVRTALLTAFFVLGTGLAALAGPRVAVVDMALVFKSYPEVIKTTYYLKQKKDEYQQQIDKEREQIESLTSQLTSDRSKLNDQQIQEQENKKRRMLFDLQTKFQRFKEKLQELEQQEFEKIRDNVRQALAKLARARRIELVIEKQWLYYGESEDLTDALITSLGGEVPGTTPTRPGGR